MIQFEIPGPVRGKGRPRFARIGGFVRTYTDEATASYESLVKLAAAPAVIDMIEGAAAVSITVYKTPPKSMSKAARERALAQLSRPTGKPDLDNIAKLVCDALNGIAWTDDSQVASLCVTKRWAERDYCEVKISTVEAW